MKNLVHFKKEYFDVYIGRPTKWGNPWSHKNNTLAEFQVNTREEAIENYRKWLSGEDFENVLIEQRKWILKNLPCLKDKILGCWCAPKSCHGEILLDLLNKEVYKG